LRIRDQLAIDRVRDPALEAADRFHGLLACGSFASVVDPSLGVEAELGDRGDVDHVVDPPVPSSGESVAVLFTGGGIKGGGAGPGREPVPVGEACDVADVGEDPGRHDRSDAVKVHQSGVASQDHGLEFRGGLLDLRIDRDQLSELLGRDAATCLPGDVTRPDAGEDRLGLQGCDVALRLAGGGTVTFRQWKAMDGGVQQYAGTMRLESSYLHGTTPQVYLGPAIVDAAVIGNVGNTAGFVVDNAKGDPDVALNVRK